MLHHLQIVQAYNRYVAWCSCVSVTAVMISVISKYFQCLCCVQCLQCRPKVTIYGIVFSKMQMIVTLASQCHTVFSHFSFVPAPHKEKQEKEGSNNARLAYCVSKFEAKQKKMVFGSVTEIGRLLAIHQLSIHTLAILILKQSKRNVRS